jgi:purine-binding chemotaxis protein CheW
MATTAPSKTGTGPAEAAQLVVFRVEASEYALPVANVGEVLRMVAIAPVPESPTWVLGVINLRGEVIPVIDLRTRLGVPAQAAGLNTPIIVAEHEGQSVGLVADSVTELISVPLEAIEQPDAQVVGVAVARSGARLIPVLDLERVCSGSL